jgi:hypothetical protein
LYALDMDAQILAFTGLLLGPGVTVAACSDNTLRVWRHDAPAAPMHTVALGDQGTSRAVLGENKRCFVGLLVY